MSDLADPRTRAAPAAWLTAVALALNTFAIVTVTYWIYRARVLYAAAHPEEVARRPATISRAIADPAIGEPFAVWITLSGILLLFGVFALGGNYIRIGRALGPVTPRAGRIVATAGLVVLVMQAAASLGMHLLSTYRFPDGRDMHMLGSFLFFIAQALVVISGLVISRTILRDAAALSWVEETGHMSRRAVRLRVGFGWFTMGLAVLYMGLFYGKDVVEGPTRLAVLHVYTNAEALLITCFLGFLALYQTDLWRLIRAQRGA